MRVPEPCSDVPQDHACVGPSEVHPPQPRASLATVLALGDVHLVTLLPGCERLVFPSKLYGIAAVARPVVVVAPAASELATVVTTHGFGRAFTRDQSAAIASTLRELPASPALCARFGQAAAHFAAEVGGPSTAADRWEAALASSTLAAPSVG